MRKTLFKKICIAVFMVVLLVGSTFYYLFMLKINKKRRIENQTNVLNLYRG